MNSDFGAATDKPGLAAIRAQRELALVCAWLSLAIAVTAVISNFRAEPAEFREIRSALEQHRRLLTEEEQNLRANEEALQQNRAALAGIRRSLHLSNP